MLLPGYRQLADEERARQAAIHKIGCLPWSPTFSAGAIHVIDTAADAQAWADRNAVPFVDIIAALDRRRDVLVSWVHLNADGNRLVADALANEIAAHACGTTAEATTVASF